MFGSETARNGRTAHAKAVLGPELYARLADTKVLLVGAGGIGCELRTLAFLLILGIEVN